MRCAFGMLRHVLGVVCRALFVGLAAAALVLAGDTGDVRQETPVAVSEAPPPPRIDSWEADDFAAVPAATTLVLTGTPTNADRVDVEQQTMDDSEVDVIDVPEGMETDFIEVGED